MVPGGPGPTEVRVLERGGTRVPGRAIARRGLGLEEVVPRALRGEAVRDVVGDGQIPRLGVAVALVADTDRAVRVRDQRHRTGVPAGRLGEGRSSVTVVRATRRVRPVKRRVDREQVGPEVPGGVDQLVDPLDAHWSVVLRLDRQRGCVVDLEPVAALRGDRAVAPHGRGRPEARGQDLLGELPHGDLVVVHRLAARHGQGARPRHHGRDQQGRRILGYTRWVERAARDRRRDRHLEQLAADPADEDQPRPCATTDTQEIPSSHP